MEEDCPTGISLDLTGLGKFLCLTYNSGYRYDLEMREKQDGHWVCTPAAGDRFVPIGPANLTDWEFKE